MSTEPVTFAIAVGDFDTALLPESARDRARDEFPEAVTEFFRRALGATGSTTVVVTPDEIRVAWRTEGRASPLDRVLSVLRSGRHAEGVQLLRLLLSREPEDVDLLFNLGVALNKLRQFDEAADVLAKALAADPAHGHAPVALAVALSHTGRNDEAIRVLADAVERHPDDAWGRLNLGATLLKAGRAEESVEHLEQATTLQPENARAWLGLGDAYRAIGKNTRAEAAYRRVMELDPHGEGGELARQGLSKLAHTGFRAANEGRARPDAVEYCLDALKQLRARKPEEVRQIVFDLTQLGGRGIKTDDSAKSYELRQIPGKRSGLEMVCWLYVGVQMVAPGTDVGFDLAREYEVARSILGEV